MAEQMTEQMTEIEPSLLPYLDETRIGFRLTLPGLGATDPSHKVFSESSGPFAHILDGFITTGDNHSLAKVFLLAQPDRYAITSSELKPISNLQVDKLWQSAWDRVNEQADADFSPVLPSQIDARGRLRPLRSIFHCRQKNRFCHPLCPHCGGALTLCRDDQMLHDAGLQRYSEALDRYLYCPACRQASKTPVFYALEHYDGQPACLQSARQLIEGFSRLLTREKFAGDLPCVGCDEAANCYGPQTLAHDRMDPVFFYPFFMLMQPAPSMNVLEFLDLLSGASFDQTAQRLIQKKKTGRLRKMLACQDQFSSGSGLLFSGSAVNFLEVLYLKLTLLEELVALIQREAAHLSESLAGMSLEALWVYLPSGTARLPLFWNFSLQIIDRVGRPQGIATPGILPAAQARTFLGTAWFYVLLVDERQDMTVVQTALEPWLSHADGIDHLLSAPDEEFDPVFAAHHLIRPPMSTPIEPEWQALWRRTLALGLGLLRAGLTADPAWSDELFCRNAEVLKKEVRELLFQAPMASATAKPAVRASISAEAAGATENEPDAVDQKIAEILHTILGRWPLSVSEVEGGTDISTETRQVKARESARPNEDGDFEETVILGASPLSDTQPSADRGQPPALEETVVMAPAQKETRRSVWQEDMQSTVIINPQDPDVGPPPIETENDRTADDDLEKTVIIGSPPPMGDQGRRQPQKKTRETKDKGTPPAAPDDLEKTVIISPDKMKNRKP